jgi:hypothetical protein
MRDAIRDWLREHLLQIISSTVILVTLGMVLAAKLEYDEREAFMRECMKDRSEKECRAIWRESAN